ncbi:DUF4253 domain-containing protein [Microbispora sp. NPDC049125]|uniref:DUF4253 domain-containing protein n=1 Tax=Microbispora sp. NPDC049125 TaxID=3154929 RepID=UPI0034651843
MSNSVPLQDGLGDLFGEEMGKGRTLSVALPPGRIILSDEGKGEPALWITEEPASSDLWTQLHTEHQRSGLWPLMLSSLSDDYNAGALRPWESGELYLSLISSPDLHDPAALLAAWWSQYTESDAESDPLPETERLAVTAPFGRQWPGLAPAGVIQADPDVLAGEYAAHLVSRDPSMRLGLVAAGRGADSLSACGWSGPMNYTNDTGEIAAVVRGWEDRYGVRVVGAGFSELFLSVAAPPTTLDEALHVAAEHFALSPDNIWQGQAPYTLAAYAEHLMQLNTWEFWWD